MNLVLHVIVVAALACFTTGAGMVTFGYKAKQRCMLGGGIILAFTGTIQQLYELAHQFDLGSWAILAGLGISFIILGSTLESKAGNIKS
ncbi:MAG: hypothetical protein ACE5EH_07495, partial [Gammaproteobacteria bacterium]